jgi:phosphoribosylamine--glycine ligase
VVIEEFLEGEEASFLVLTDGREIEALVTSQDHKKIGEGDTGLNTGGMGAYSPAPVVTEEIHEAILGYTRRIVDGMRSEGVEFRGVLYDGVIISDGKIRWLEDNVRFGDPEAQPIVMRMESDLYPYLVACSEGRLGEMGPIEWRKEAAVCVVMASGGYPVKYETGKTIFGLDEAGLMKDVIVFHAGTAKKGESIVTSGGRVLGVTALGAGIDVAIQKAYKAVGKIKWENEYHRKDIGYRALGRDA